MAEEEKGMKAVPNILGETYSFRKTNWKSFRVLYAVAFIPFIFLFFFVLNSDAAWHGTTIPVILFSLTIVSLFFSAGGWGLLTTITIGPDGISYKSPLKALSFSWNELKTTGIYVQKRYSKDVLDTGRYRTNFFFYEKFIFISTLPLFRPYLWMFPRDDYFDFTYRAKAWELIESYTHGHNPPSPYIYPGGNLGFSQ